MMASSGTCVPHSVSTIICLGHALLIITNSKSITRWMALHRAIDFGKSRIQHTNAIGNAVAFHLTATAARNCWAPFPKSVFHNIKAPKLWIAIRT